ncbi:MAG: hypothetical protein JSR54_03800, partial [Proteobacteria bacterium]|nr:hypothetical protein [Pseudomonadota bacterium]
MGPLAISVLLLGALAGFAALCARKIGILLHLRPDVRWDDVGARLRSVLVNGLLQQRMIRREWRPGVMHAAIFLGFLALLLRKVELLAIGYDESFSIPGATGSVIAAAKDGVEVIVLVAVGYAFYRRLWLRPRRLEPNREALLILSLIAA